MCAGQSAGWELFGNVMTVAGGIRGLWVRVPRGPQSSNRLQNKAIRAIGSTAPAHLCADRGIKRGANRNTRSHAKAPKRRQRARGYVEELPSGALRVVVYAGIDPVTKRRHYLRETIPANTRKLRRRPSEPSGGFRPRSTNAGSPGPRRA
jgi:hypothetical protein